MYQIYKVTNTKNGKFYIGKTTDSIEQRWKRHIEDAISGRLDTHFARAIRKWGKDSFIIEEIDTATNEEELNQKEIYWIAFYDSAKKGYNKTDGGEGGNTYKYKTEEEIAFIKEKIKESKMGRKNPMARKVKGKNILTGEELHFDSCEDCARFFNWKNHAFVVKRCKRQTKYLFQREWVFAYEEDEYINDYQTKKKQRRKRQIRVLDTVTNEEKEFDSCIEAKNYYQTKSRFSPHFYPKPRDVYWILKRYKVTVLK